MADGTIPEMVRRFLRTYIDSVAQLEALLLLRENPTHEWGADQVAKRLYIPPQQAAALLAALTTRGLLGSRTGYAPLYCYEPRNDDLRKQVDQVAETYRDRLVPVTHFLHAKESSNIQRFADAFKLGEEG